MNFSTKCFGVFLLSSLLLACVPLDDGGDPYGRSGGNYGGYNNDPYNNDPYDYERRERERLDRERYEIDRERDRLEDERRRLEEDRRRNEEDRQRQPSTNSARPKDTCPSGFYPSSSKCSDKERRRGCKDMRNSSGQLCVAGR